MINKQKSEEQNESFLHKKIDPELEAKVDALMDVDAEPKPINVAKPVKSNGVSELSSAPLLPNDKLPNFDEKGEQTQDPKINNVDTLHVDNSASNLLKDEIGIEDRSTEQAVEDIVANESNRLIAIDDAKAEINEKARSKGLIGKLKEKLSNFWANPVARRVTIFLTIISIIVISVIPVSRYFTLNLLGIRASMSVKILDNQTAQPLKNVDVSIDGSSARTDIDGFVKIEKIKLGKHTIVAKKPAFADSVNNVTIGFGSNPLGSVGLVSVGSSYSFEVKDFVSGQPVDAEATSGESSARANEEGEIVLVLEDEKEDKVKIQITAENYRTEELTLDPGEKELRKLELVPAKNHVFVSKRDGKLDLFKIDIDGKNEKKILAGTGKEKEDTMAILSHKTKNSVAFVSSRGSKMNQDGYALSSLNIINLDNNKAKEIAISERIQLIDFIDDRLVYVSIAQGASAASPDRHKLISYDINSGDIKELARANYFNDVMSAKGYIYYSPSSYKTSDDQVGMYEVKPDGTNRTTIYGQEVWNLFRLSYYKIAASVQQTWYEYDIGSAEFVKLDNSPAELKSRIYVDSPNSELSAWSEDRDGKGTLLIYNPKTNEADKVLVSQNGLINPIYWLDNDHLVYRIKTDTETADYVVSISGGDAKKIVDVTNIAGIDRWYYY